MCESHIHGCIKIGAAKRKPVSWIIWPSWTLNAGWRCLISLGLEWVSIPRSSGRLGSTLSRPLYQCNWEVLLQWKSTSFLKRCSLKRDGTGITFKWIVYPEVTTSKIRFLDVMQSQAFQKRERWPLNRRVGDKWLAALKLLSKIAVSQMRMVAQFYCWQRKASSETFPSFWEVQTVFTGKTFAQNTNFAKTALIFSLIDRCVNSQGM